MRLNRAEPVQPPQRRGDDPEETLTSVIDDVLAGRRPTAATPAAYPDEAP